MMARGLLVVGTSSDAGKSLLTTALCRVLARRGVRVAPFKAQNMSNNSMVCRDGGEIGRAQYLQATAARAEPETAMNPVLLKPGSDLRSHVVLRGRPAGTLGAAEFAGGRAQLAAAAFAAYRELAERYDVIVCEGAGSPAEINLRAGDFVNMGLAREFELPTLLVGDIDRGGVLASLYGTVALLEPADRDLVRGYVINKFRGEVSLLEPGLAQITELTGVPCWGVLPWLPGVWLDGEDTLRPQSWADEPQTDPNPLRVAVIRFPRISNSTDLDAFAAEPGVEVTVTADPAAVRAADLVVLPGTRSTIADLRWMRSLGLDVAIRVAAAAGRPVLGVCGGFQMLGRRIEDPSGVENEPQSAVDGLDLLPMTVTFTPDKTLGRPVGRWRGRPASGYEIHHGRARLDPGAEPFPGGTRSGNVWGTHWHGLFEDDGLRREWLAQVTGRPIDRAATGFAARRERMIDALADAAERHLHLAALFAQVGMDGI